MFDLVADKDKHQWFTPVWAAEKLIETHFSDLDEKDVICEPTCGIGTFLSAVPDHIKAYGIELDDDLAAQARKNTMREVITGNFLEVDLPYTPTLVLGNPPFDLEVVDAILEKSHKIMEDDSRVALILPSYAFQTASRIVGYKSKWSIYQEMIPRNLFKGMQKPLCFAIFKKDRVGKLIGFSLYEELHDINSMPKQIAETVSKHKSPWQLVIKEALNKLGGEAKLADIYQVVEPKKPTENPWWKEKIRQTLNRSNLFVKINDSTYALA